MLLLLLLFLIKWQCFFSLPISKLFGQNYFRNGPVVFHKIFNEIILLVFVVVHFVFFWQNWAE